MVRTSSKLTQRRLFALLKYFDRPISIRERGSFEDGVFFFITGKFHNALVKYPKKVMGIAMSRYGFCSELLRTSGWEKNAVDGYKSFRKRVIERKSTIRRWVRQYHELRSKKEAMRADQSAS